MRARVRKDASLPTVPKAKPSVPWAVRVAATLPKRVRVSNPLLGEDPVDTFAVFDLGMPHDLSMFAKADEALGALFIDAEPWAEVLVAKGFELFHVDGSDAVLATNHSLPDAPWIKVIKAEWSTAYVNDLPDSAFLHVLPDGEKDDEGKTKPRTLRMFPYRDADGAVDLPHLRNALARIPQSNRIDEATKDKLTAKARKLLAEATDKLDEIVKAGKYDHINFKPPAGVASAAAKGLEFRKKGGGGGLSTGEAAEQGIGSGVARAASLKNRQNQSPDTVKRMKAFFDRHEKNKAIDPKFKGEPWRDKGYVAWLLWGGDPGRAWANKVVAQMEAADEKAKADKGDLAIDPGDPGHLQPEQGRRYRRVRTKDAVIVDAIGLLTKSVTKIEGEDEDDSDERYILGVVLEPDEVDSQGDTISAEEIRRAAHGYMQDFGNVGLQHQTFVNDKIKILETYIAPVDFEIDGETVKAGTWLMAFRVVDDSIWKAIKDGLLTGLSIGGTGLRLAVA